MDTARIGKSEMAAERSRVASGLRTTRLARCCLIALFAVSTVALAVPVQAQGTQSRVAYTIPAGPLGPAINQLAVQSRLQITYAPDLVAGKTTNGLSGPFTPTEALQRLLSGSGVIVERVSENTIVLKKAPSQTLPQKPKPQPRAAEPQSDGKLTELPEILVTGTRSLNTDIERTRDDVQPYVVFHRETIERSGAVSIDDFLKQRLPMNTAAVSPGQTNSAEGNRSAINLRGLGMNQTLILIDGRRTSNTVSTGSILLQQDLNGIPLAAIERIEILPTTASGIYGGDATGGAINIILRRDYQGGEAKLTWDNTFDTDSARPRIDLATGFNLGEKTNVMITASRSQGNFLLNRDRDFVEDYRRQAFANNPGLYLPPASPPLGYLPNLRSVDGSALVLDDGTPLGSSFTHVPTGYAGASSDEGMALLANAGTYDFGLAKSSQAGGGRQTLLNAPETTSANVTVRHEFTPKVEGFLELAASNNVGRFLLNSSLPSQIFLPADALNNPFQQDLEVQVPLPTHDFSFDTRNTDRRLVAGVIVHLPKGWLAEADYVWSKTSSRDAASIGGLTPEGVAAMQDGTLDVLRDTNAYRLDLSPYLIRPGIINGPFETTTRNPTLILGGPVGTLPGGQPMLSLRLEHRDERFAAARTIAPDFLVTYPAKSQTVSSAFAELRLPLFSSLNAAPGLQELELQFSVRHDRYKVEGATGNVGLPTDPIERIDSELSSTNVTAGFRWKPVEDMVLRASYGTGFLPPNVNQLVPQPFLFPGGIVLDPRRGNTPTGEFQSLFGGNPALRPEDSKSYSVGLVLTPRFLAGLRASIDYTRIEKTDNIAAPSFEPLLASEALFTDRIVRGPNLPGDPPEWAGPITFIDSSLINIARAEVEAIDLQLDYSHDTSRWGSFHWFAVATWQTHYKTQFLPTDPVIENVGYEGGLVGTPLKFKANTGLTWSKGGWTLGWVSRYFDAYRPYSSDSSQIPSLVDSALLTQGASRVDSQLYHDVSAQYQFTTGGDGWRGELVDGLSIQFGIRNVLNKVPPRVRDTYSFYGDPRLASYWLTLSKSF